MTENTQDTPNTHPQPVVELGEQVLTSEYSSAHADAPVIPPSGGDFQSAFSLSDGSGSVGIVMGDVSGHGPEKTEQAQQLLSDLTELLNEGVSPAAALEQVNDVAEQSPDFHGFATTFVGKLETGTGELTYASGGHEPALIASADTNHADSIEELDTTGPPVGAVPADVATFHNEKATIPDGGTLLIYTDGASDVRHPENRRVWLGLPRLKALFALFASCAPARLISKMVKYILVFCRGRLSDDVALLAIRRNSEEQHAPAASRADGESAA